MFSSNTSQVSSAATYIEDVFSTWLYTGNGSTQTITNGIDLSGKGGLVWTKTRNVANSNWFIDTVRGGTQLIRSNTTEGQFTSAGTSITFGSSSYTVGSGDLNTSTQTQVSWTFRKQPKFFDVVTYTGNGARNRDISHSLGSAPGFILIKRTSAASNWSCWHTSLGTNNYLLLNSTASNSTANINPSQGATYGGYIVTSSSTTFSVSTDDTNTGDPTTGENVNANGSTYVAYLFAHNAGGFGLTGTDNVISCGSFTGGSSVNLGYEPQWLMYKRTDNVGNWIMLDTMRGFNVNDANRLLANTSGSEGAGFNSTVLTNTGFNASGETSGATYIYIAIRRGPMKTPTSGTSVFAPTAYTGNGANNRAFTTGFVSDMVWWKSRSNGTDWGDATLLIGPNRGLTLNQTSGEGSAAGYYINTYNNTGFTYGTSDVQYNGSARTYIMDAFSRAPGFFDVVCYTGTGVTTSYTHNLGVTPELAIFKRRDTTSNWSAYAFTAGRYGFVEQSTNFSTGLSSLATANATTFTHLIGGANVNASGGTYVAYLFASCPGVSKVGTYTGTGSDITINCGFTGGARFVLVKAISNSFNNGQWYVWDSVRGISSGNDPYLLLNSTNAEDTSTNLVDATSTGFIVKGGAVPAGTNEAGSTYLYLAIA